VVLFAACGDSGPSALDEADPLHKHGIKLPPPAEWEPPAAPPEPEMIEVRKPPLSPEIFPCSRCHVGGPEIVDTAPAIPHKVHLDRDLVCADCHNPDDEDAAPKIPSTETCFDCHEDLKEEPERVQAYFKSIRNADGKYVFPRRWDLEDVDPNHVGHAKAKVGCTQCHGEPSNKPFAKPKPLALMENCITCHEDRNVPAECATCHEKQTKNEPNYHKIVLRHAEHQRGCFGCHNPDDRDTLRLANGTPIEFEKSYLLCGQCHGPKLRDWTEGLHGKRTGMWDGKKEYLLCVHCHENPHAPQFPEMAPEPPPTRPKDIK
jgi:hypothetical protein